jgi:hypothetical protein
VHFLAGLFSFAILITIPWDVFETVILPRRVTRSFRFARFFLRTSWRLYSSAVRRISTIRKREAYLSFFGPLSLLVLFALWASTLIFAFATMYWAIGSAVGAAGSHPAFRTNLYFSGTTFFTLGLGDIVPMTPVAKAFAVLEAGTGFGFLAIVIAYLPTLYVSFSQRETNISLLDARAGSPPTAAELLRRHGSSQIPDGLVRYLRDWEVWAAQLMESHLTYPILCFFRSQHDNQSWVAALTAVLDVCALLIAYGEGETKWQAQLTFAITRHAVVDISQILKLQVRTAKAERLRAEDLPCVHSLLIQCGVAEFSDAGDEKLAELRALYEPYLEGLSRLLQMPMPSWGMQAIPQAGTVWQRISSPAASGHLQSGQVEPDHF